RHGKHPSIVRSDPHRSDVNQTGGSPEHRGDFIDGQNNLRLFVAFTGSQYQRQGYSLTVGARIVESP
ncbi:hypothetical protein, partial [Rhodococcus sp. BL-253-APC-6A1W]|uniref:hypothetical protein n=1 Tax=Rhodococcus sp. BL-253-APC-6A1W TaxID=2725307 RepID=UPI00197D3277